MNRASLRWVWLRPRPETAWGLAPRNSLHPKDPAVNPLPRGVLQLGLLSVRLRRASPRLNRGALLPSVPGTRPLPFGRNDGTLDTGMHHS
jgi:hypothetical protein